MAAMTHLEHFPSSAALHRFLLDKTTPGTLVLVPHRRLARQVWHQQRLANLEAGRRGWEPLPLMTLPDWWSELYQDLWPPLAKAPVLVRLALWRQSIETGPSLEGVAPDQEWARALDDAHELLLRHGLPLTAPAAGDSPLVGWRRQVTGIFRELLREQGWLAPGEVPLYLHAALEKPGLPLPARLFVVGLTTPAPAEERWLEAVARRLPVTRLLVRGNPANLQQGVVLPDREEEMAWVGSQLVAGQREGLPLHRLAVTSPVMDRYQGGFQGILKELLGPALGEAGAAYNLSQGPRFADTPLFTAALLPLTFLALGERREDLASLLLSPYYQVLKSRQAALALWDRRFREKGAAQGWEHLRKEAAREAWENPAMEKIIGTLDHLWGRAAAAPATGRAWAAWLEEAWQRLGFPGELEGGEKASSSASPLSWGTSPWPWGTRSSRPAGPWPGCTRALKTTSCRAPGCRRPGSRSWAGSRPGGWILTASFAWG